MHRAVRESRPAAVVIDPITDFTLTDSLADNKAMLMRLIDFLKSENITVAFTSLTSAGAHPEQTEAAVSSLIDTWIVLRDLERQGRRRRVLCVLKSRGMAHSHDVREFRLTDRGVDLGDDQPAQLKKRPEGPARKGERP
jgi:circadian clock protein KaiC